MRSTPETDIALNRIKARDRKLTVGEFGAVDASPGKKAGKFCGGNTEQLLMEDVVYILLEDHQERFIVLVQRLALPLLLLNLAGGLLIARDLRSQKTLCYLPQENAAFGAWVEESGVSALE